MMAKHLEDGRLRAALDGELSPEESRHLESCVACRARLDQVRVETGLASSRLSFLRSSGDAPAPNLRAAWNQINERAMIRKETNMLKKIFVSPLFRFGFAVVLILALVIAIPSTRALADQLLNLFRVQRVAVIPVDFTGMEQLTDNSVFGKQISQLLSESITMTQKPGDPVTASDATQASQLAGFTVRLPNGLTPSNISVTKAAAFTFTVDRQRAQALLDEAGRSDLVLPQAIDGAEISVKIPAGASVSYGNCPQPKVDNPEFSLNPGGSTGRRYADCLILAEIPSPTVNAPAQVNVAQLAQIGLEFTGMTPEQAAAFTSTVDWTSSLVVPIPKNAATYQQVAVDGVTGTLIQRPADDAPQFALLWVKNGVIYAIGGLGDQSQKALQMANSLP